MSLLICNDTDAAVIAVYASTKRIEHIHVAPVPHFAKLAPELAVTSGAGSSTLRSDGMNKFVSYYISTTQAFTRVL